MGDFTSTRSGSAGFPLWGFDGGIAAAARSGGRRGGRGMASWGQHYFLRAPNDRAADADAVVAALHFQFGDPGFRRQIDQLSDFIYCHQWFSLTDRLA